MKGKLFSIIALFGVLGVCLLGSCKDDDDSLKKREENLEKFVASLQVPSQPEIPARNVDSTFTERHADEICTYKEYEAGASFDESFVLDPSVDVIYPGALINGASINSGDYTPVNIKRAPITIYSDLLNKDGNVYKEIENPNGATVTQAIKDLLYDAEINGATTANIIFEVKEIITAEQLDMELGVSVNAKKFEFSNKFDFSSQRKKRNFLIRYIQPMYHISVVNPTKPSELFAKDITAGDLEQALANKAMPCYVGSVAYGRAVYALMQTEESSSTIKNELEAAINFAVKGNVDSNFEKYKNESSYSYSGTIIGGNADDAVKGIQGIEDIVNFIKKQGNFGKDNPAAMLSYKLNKISDNSTFAIKKAAKYTTKDCETYKGGIRLKSITARRTEHSGGDGLEPYGNVKVFINGDDYTIFTLNESANYSIINGRKDTIEGTADNYTIGGKTCYLDNGPNLNLGNVGSICLQFNITDHDGKGDKNDPYFTFKGTKYGEERNDLITIGNNSSLKNAVDTLQSGKHSAEFDVDLYRVYNKVEYDIHGRKDFYDDPEIIRLNFVITLK